MMQTKEELIAGLTHAVEILRRAEGLQTNIENLKKSNLLINILPEKKMHSHMGICRTIVIGLFVWMIVCYIVDIHILFIGGSIMDLIGISFYLLLGDSRLQIVRLLCTAITLALSLPGIFFVRNLLNKGVDAINEKNTARNNERHARIRENLDKKEQLLQQLERVQAEYFRDVAPWYPDTYSYSYAAESMLKFVRDGRADTLKEAENLYETVMHQQRVEQNQKEQIRQQQLQTVLLNNSINSLRKDINADRKFYYDQSSGSYIFRKVSGKRGR